MACYRQLWRSSTNESGTLMRRAQCSVACVAKFLSVFRCGNSQETVSKLESGFTRLALPFKVKRGARDCVGAVLNPEWNEKQYLTALVKQIAALQIATTHLSASNPLANDRVAAVRTVANTCEFNAAAFAFQLDFIVAEPFQSGFLLRTVSRGRG